ncbi:hypothetical protein [Wolbachia endosymbiont (group A) of Clivina fossor]|uniref:actin-bundling T4SS effector WalE1 family protein n=1 Tax=Wolbachia endosymbiont (group A) of Clivina fossor TaxID=3066133 RepID=UPI003132D1DE
MLASKQTNSSPVKKNSPFMETVQDKLKDIKNFSNWSAKEQMIAVGAVGVMVGALLPFVAVALPVAATGAIVALTLFFAYKAVEYTFKGLKWSAEKTVDGAKYTAEKVKDASVYTAEKAREGYHSVKGAISSVRRATREGTGATLGKMGRSLSNLSESMSSLDAIPYSIGNEGQTVVLKTEEKTRNFNSVKEMFIKEVLEDKAVNSSALTKEIFSKLGEKILEKAYSVGGPQGAKKDQLINQLKQQADFVNKLDAKKLQNLLSKNNNNLYEIFSEHHDEIKRIVKERKTEHKLSNSIENLNKVAGKYGTLRGSIQFGGSNVEKQLHEPSSSDLGVLDKTATIGQKPSGKQSIPVALPKVPESPTLEDEWSEFVDQRVKKHVLSTPKSTRSNSLDEGTLTRSNSSDSAIGLSDSSTPSEYCTPNASGVSTPSEYCTPNASGVSTPIGNRFSQGVDGEGLKRRLERLKSEPVKQKRDFTSSDFHDSGRGSSGSSTPKSPSPEDLSKARAELKKTGYLDKLVGQPSTQMAVEADVHPQLATIQGATNVKA